MVETRVPLGCWLVSGVDSRKVDNDMTLFEMSAQLPQYSSDGTTIGPTRKDIKIKARSVRAVQSTNSAKPDAAYRTLDRVARLALCSDDEMLLALGGPA
jgi:hypothetical protein